MKGEINKKRCRKISVRRKREPQGRKGRKKEMMERCRKGTERRKRGKKKEDKKRCRKISGRRKRES